MFKTTASLIEAAVELFAAVNPTKPYKPRKLKTDPYHTTMRRAAKLRRTPAAKKAAAKRTRKLWEQRNAQALKKRAQFVRKARKTLGLDKKK